MVFIGAITRLVDDITAFNKDYTGDLKIKMKYM